MNELKEIISEYTGVEPKEICDDMSLKADIGIDSFGIVSMICEIERAFNVEIPDSVLGEFRTLIDLENYIEDHKLA